MGRDAPDEADKTIAELMQLAITDEEYDPHDYIFHNPICIQDNEKENKDTTAYNIDYICCNVLMSAVEVSLVNAMSREQILKDILWEIKEEYDYILLDCGPSLGMITINALVASDLALIPLQAEKFAAFPAAFKQAYYSGSGSKKHCGSTFKIRQIMKKRSKEICAFWLGLSMRLR